MKADQYTYSVALQIIIKLYVLRDFGALQLPVITIVCKRITYYPHILTQLRNSSTQILVVYTVHTRIYCYMYLERVCSLIFNFD
jgi:hypothetical protein